MACHLIISRRITLTRFYQSQTTAAVANSFTDAIIFRLICEFHIMEDEDWVSCSEGTSDSEVDLQGSDDEDHYHTSDHVPELRLRKDASKARWNDDMKMAEVVEARGKMWNSMGVVRSGKVYCSIEEALFMAERGALLLLNDMDTPLSLNDICEKVSEQRSGCCWESFHVYRHLKSLGYVVGHHGVPWSIKRTKHHADSVESDLPTDGLGVPEDNHFVNEFFDKMQINEVKPVFDVFLPNSKFKKTSPGNPSFILCLTRGLPPSRALLKDLERQCNDIPLKFTHLDHGQVTIYSFDRVELPILP